MAATRTIASGYDPFGLFEISARTMATGAATLDTHVDVDAITLHPLRLIGPNRTELGMTYDGFGRPVLSTVRPPGGVVGALSVTSYLGFEGGDPLGRRVVDTLFDNPVAPATAGAALGHTSTTLIDDFGRTTRTVLGLGSDYANDLVVGAVNYDALGRVEFVADTFHTGQTESTAYGTTSFYNTDGTLKCTVRGYGKQTLPPAMFGSTNEASERYSTWFSHDFIAGQLVEGAWSPDAVLTGSPQAGVQRLTRATAVGRVVRQEIWSPITRIEHSEYTYDRLGYLSSMTRYRLPGGFATPPSDPVQWTFKFDSFGQLLRHVEPNTVPREKSYSNWGELLNGHTAASTIGPTPQRDERMIYDGLGRLTHAEQLSNGVVVPETVYDYHYDLGVSPTTMMDPTYTLGRLAWVSGSTSNVYFSYDTSGRRHMTAYQDPSKALYIQTSNYDGDGKLIELGLVLPDDGQNPDTNPTPEVVKYDYDSAQRLRRATFADPNGATRDLFVANAVDAFGRVRAAHVGKAVYHASYADVGRRLFQAVVLQSPSGKVRDFHINGYDALGREQGRSENTGSAATSSVLTHSYDLLGRLAKSVRIGGSAPSNRTFRYDALGNVLQQVDVLGNQSVDLSYATTVGGNRDQLCSIGYGGPAPPTCNVFHDAQGNIVRQPTRDGVRMLTYLPSGQLSSASKPDGTRADFRYDAFGEVQELDIQGLTSDTRKDRRYGVVERRDVTGPGSPSSILSRTFDLGGLTVSRRGATDLWAFAIGESRGNRFFVDQDGEFVQDVDYEAFGEARPQGAAPGSVLHSREQWNGGDNLAAFGLSQLGARLYDPVVGRFLSADPRVLMGSASTSNPYTFAFNDPINASDPSGLCPPEGCGPGSDSGGGGSDIGDATRPKGHDVDARHSPTPAEAYALGAGLAAWNFIGSGYGAFIKIPQVPDTVASTSFNLGYDLEYAAESSASTQTSRLDCFTSVGGFGDCAANGFGHVVAVPIRIAYTIGCIGVCGEAGEHSKPSPSNWQIFKGAVEVGTIVGPGFVEEAIGEDVAATEAGAIRPGVQNPHVNGHGFSARNVNEVGGTTNCASCALAMDSVLGGNPLRAANTGVTLTSYVEMRVGQTFTRGLSAEAVASEIGVAGRGARGIVFGSRGAGKIGHFFNVVNQKGVVRFIDGQSGTAANLADGFVEFWLVRTN